MKNHTYLKRFLSIPLTSSEETTVKEWIDELEKETNQLSEDAFKEKMNRATPVMIFEKLNAIHLTLQSVARCMTFFVALSILSMVTYLFYYFFGKVWWSRHGPNLTKILLLFFHNVIAWFLYLFFPNKC